MKSLLGSLTGGPRHCTIDNYIRLDRLVRCAVQNYAHYGPHSGPYDRDSGSRLQLYLLLLLTPKSVEQLVAAAHFEKGANSRASAAGDNKRILEF